MKKSTLGIVSLITISLAAIACDEQQLSGPGFVCDVTNPVQDLFLSPSNSSVLVRSPARSSDFLALTATATNRLGGARTDVPIKFSSSDPAVATVDSLGIVHPVKPGSVTIKAETCGKTATAKVTVVGAVITVQVTPSASTAVVGDTVQVVARAVGQTGQSLSDVKFTFSASPGGLVSFTTVDDSTVKMATLGAGTVTVSATGEGTVGSSPVVVLAKAFLNSVATAAGAIDAGGHATCGLITLGRAYCWGLNDLSQLGSATDSLCFRNTDTQTDTLETVVKRCSLVPKRLAPTVTFSAISEGDSSGCGISTTGGRVYCWGNNSHGEIGDGSGTLKGVATLISGGLNFTSVSVGGSHACGITLGGTAYCWGQDTRGQLGDARKVNSSTPIPVSGGGGTAILSAIAAGRTHTCGLAPDGTAFCWGSNFDGELGAGGVGGTADTPALVSGGISFTSISAGGDSIPGDSQPRAFSCGVAVGGAAYCWGDNSVGQLGIGSIGGPSPVPVPVAGGQTFTRVTVGGTHACGLTAGGAVYCWGGNVDLQLGRGPFTGTDAANGTPQQVSGGELPSGVTFTTVSAGVNHTCAIGSDGFAYCWGSNVYGSLGNTLQAAFRGLPQKVATPQ